jgi:hypothetical protein
MSVLPWVTDALGVVLAKVDEPAGFPCRRGTCPRRAEDRAYGALAGSCRGRPQIPVPASAYHGESYDTEPAKDSACTFGPRDGRGRRTRDNRGYDRGRSNDRSRDNNRSSFRGASRQNNDSSQNRYPKTRDKSTPRSCWRTRFRFDATGGGNGRCGRSKQGRTEQT